MRHTDCLFDTNERFWSTGRSHRVLTRSVKRARSPPVTQLLLFLMTSLYAWAWPSRVKVCPREKAVGPGRSPATTTTSCPQPQRHGNTIWEGTGEQRVVIDPFYRLLIWICMRRDCGVFNDLTGELCCLSWQDFGASHRFQGGLAVFSVSFCGVGGCAPCRACYSCTTSLSVSTGI